MNDRNIYEHRFYTYEELVEKLKAKGLTIIDEQNLIFYFKSFNYQKVINECNKGFLINRNFKKYLPYANSQMIIDLFNFNRSLSLIITNDIHSIEMQLSASIANELMKRINFLHDGHTSFGCLSTEEKYSFFRYDNSEKITQFFSELQDNFNQLSKTKEYLNRNWKRWEEVPIYLLSLVWTFGTTIDLFCNLNDEVQNEILNTYFSSIKGINIKTFEVLLYYFRDLRNKISHNEVIYNFQFSLKKLLYKIKKFNAATRTKLTNKIKNDFPKLFSDYVPATSDFKLISMITIIEKITNNFGLEKSIFQQIKWLEESINNGCHHDQTQNTIYIPCKKAWKNICESLGYKK